MKKDSVTKPTTLHLTPELESRLGKAKRARRLGEEIRERLEASFAQDDLPEPTRKLINQITELAKRLPQKAHTTGSPEWFSSPALFEAFEAGIAELLSAYKPEKGQKSDLGGDDPKTFGRILARVISEWKLP